MADNSASPADESFLVRHEFIIRRLHSLSGLIPVGAFMIVHLLTNASVNDSPGTYQKLVYGIHGLGDFLPIIEWVFIFIPLIFHAVVGVAIIAGGVPNSTPTSGNYRYVLQRVTGMIALVFILWHVFHMHGGIHSQWWLETVVRPLGGGKFSAYNAASTLGAAMQTGLSLLVIAGYAVGVVACVYHLANGLWTMGITWGVWVNPPAQKWASVACLVFGLGLGAIGLAGLYGAATVDIEAAREVEDAMYEAKTSSGEVKENEHKRAGHGHEEEEDPVAQATP